MKRWIIAVLASCLWIAGVSGDEKPQGPAPSIPAAWSGKVTDTAQLPIEQNAWGTLQWVCNEKLMPGSAQTVGLATILAGKHNPVHYHPNCEEVLYVISGQGLHSYDGRTILLKAGMTIRIPAKVKHNLVNTGTETLRTLVSYSSGDRKTVFLEEPPAKQVRFKAMPKKLAPDANSGEIDARWFAADISNIMGL
ncbi:MAG: cupin domain-containing protein [Verrucomicrobiota bacterium]|jgi:mannose-6-phosphate isomerase-like protein (cupin superfamily)